MLFAVVLFGSSFSAVFPGARLQADEPPASTRFGDPFAASPAELLAAADAAIDDALGTREAIDTPAVMLWHDAEYRFDAEGRITARRYWVYRLLDASAVEAWSRSRVRWSPWYQERPEARLRVVTAAGVEHRLESDDYADRPAPENAGGRVAERRLVEARLPGLGPGAVVEEEVVVRDRLPLSVVGTANRHYVALPVPTLAGRLVLDAPVTLPLRYGVRKLPAIEPERTILEAASGGPRDRRVRLDFAFVDLPATRPAEEGVPGHRPRFPHVAFSTGRDWSGVAEAFGAAVDRAISGEADRETTTLARSAIRSSTRSDPGSVAASVHAVTAAVRSRARFDGFDLAATPIEPRAPDAVLEAGEGDALDLAVTLVAALRRVGVDARVALVNAGFDVDVEPRLPGLGLFDHALVHLPAAPDGIAWIDPSAPFARAGELPLAVQGRFALVTGSPTPDELVRTPTSKPADNRAIEIREVFLSDYGPGRVVESCEYYGSAERTQRRITGGLEPMARRQGYEAYVRAFHRAEALGELQEMSADDLSGPFRLRLEALRSSRAVTGLDFARVEIPSREMARRLPPVLLEGEGPRQEEFIFPEPFVTEWRYEVHPPPGFRPLDPPAAARLRLGPATYSQDFLVRDDGTVLATLRFDVGQRLLAPSQVEAVRRGVVEFLERPNVVLAFESIATGDLETDRVGDAVAALRAAVEHEPGRAGHRVRLARALLRGGEGTEAVRQAGQAVALAPRSALAHWMLGKARTHGAEGRLFGPGADLAAARRSFDEALRLAAGDERLGFTVALDRARLLAVDDTGERLAGEDLEPALDAYRRLVEHGGDEISEARLEWLRLLRDAGRFETLAEEAGRALATIEERSSKAGAARTVAEALDLDAPAIEALALVARAILDDALPSEPIGPTVASRAVRELIAARRYALAAELARRRGESGPWIDRLAEAVPFESLDLHPDDPLTPVRGILVAFRHDPPRLADLEQWVHPRRFGGFSEGETATLRRIFDARIPSELAASDETSASTPAAGSSTARADLVLAAAEPELSGAPHLGYRATFAEGTIFLVHNGDALAVWATGDDLEAMGEEIRRRLDAGDVPGARRWLDWTREIVVGENELDPEEPFGVFWPAEWDEDDPPSADRARLAAAALPGDPRRSRAVLDRVPAAPPRGVDEADWRRALEVASERVR